MHSAHAVMAFMLSPLNFPNCCVIWDLGEAEELQRLGETVDGAAEKTSLDFTTRRRDETGSALLRLCQPLSLAL